MSLTFKSEKIVVEQPPNNSRFQVRVSFESYESLRVMRVLVVLL